MMTIFVKKYLQRVVQLLCTPALDLLSKSQARSVAQVFHFTAVLINPRFDFFRKQKSSVCDVVQKET
jgi:hypothetical protein